MNHAACERDRSKRRLRIAAEVQNAAASRKGATGQKTVIPADEQQRTVAHRGSTRIRVHPAQRQRPCPILHQTLRASEDRAHRTRLCHIRCSPGDQGAVLYHAARKSDRSQRRLRIAAEVQDAARCRDGAASRKSVIATGKH